MPKDDERPDTFIFHHAYTAIGVVIMAVKAMKRADDERPGSLSPLIARNEQGALRDLLASTLSCKE